MGDSLTKPPFGVTSAEVVINCPDEWSQVVSNFLKNKQTNISRISSNSSPPSWMNDICVNIQPTRETWKKNKLATSFYPNNPLIIQLWLTSINLSPPLLRYAWHGMPNSMALYRKGSCNGCSYGNDSQPWILMIIHGSKIENMLSSFYGAISLVNLTKQVVVNIWIWLHGLESKPGMKILILSCGTWNSMRPPTWSLMCGRNIC